MISSDISEGKSETKCFEPKCKKTLAAEDIVRNTTESQRDMLSTMQFD
jgi:hypothetical protein